MSGYDWVVTALVVLGILASVLVTINRKKKGRGCCGDCSSCNGCRK